jgi:uncharacterized protein (DUF433 family)
MAELVIVIDREVMNGTPCFRGTRVPFKNLIDYLEGGHSLGEFLRQFPSVTHEMAVQALEEAGVKKLGQPLRYRRGSVNTSKSRAVPN